MKNTLQQFSLSIIIYLCTCASTIFFITPYSFTSFIGPAAGIATALVLFFSAKVLFAIAIATVIFCLYLFFSMNIQIELSMFIIALLAIMLQGFWAKQFTLNEVNKQNWLKSRGQLLLFLFKIGPVISLVSAFTILIVVILESKTLDDNLFFTFVSCWSGSVLFSVFFTPMLLLTQGRQQLSLSKRTFIIIVSFLAFVAIGLLFKISQDFQQYQRQDTFNQVKNNLLQEIQKEIDTTTDKLNSLSALFKASDKVDLHEFTLFSEEIFQEKSSVRALEWAPIVTHKDRLFFEKKYNLILEKNARGITTKAKNRNRYAPIHYIYPSLGNESVIGLDVLANSNHVISMDEVLKNKNIRASAPVSLIQDNHENLGVIFISAVYSGAEKSLMEIEHDSSITSDKPDNLLGFVIAIAQFKNFFEDITPSNTEEVDLFIEDITSSVPYILFGQQLDASHRNVESVDLKVNSRLWRISLGEHQPWQLQQKSWQIWGVLLGATFGGILFQVLILMMAVYSHELTSQVTRKTRELILAKEHSEHKSSAKTNFLHTLTSELQAPLHAIKNFSQQLSKAENKENKRIIQNIELAQANMQKLLNMVVDLSNIELGESDVISESFDFYGFLERIDDMLSAQKVSNETNERKKRSLTFLIDSNVPHFINSDELRIQQLLIAFCEGSHDLFNCENMRLTVKVHNHHLNSATLLFVFTKHDNEAVDIAAPFSHFVKHDLSLFSTQIAMAKEVCQLMDGDANLAISDSGERVLTASIKILITSSEQQLTHQSNIFDKIEDK